MTFIKVFVYGTLKEGGRLAGQMDQVRVSSEKGTVEGIMYDLGSFPGVLLNNEGTIHGELHTYLNPNNLTLNRLDLIEGYQERGDAYNLYNRKKCEVLTENGIQTAFIYEYNGEINQSTIIPSGNWLA